MKIDSQTEHTLNVRLDKWIWAVRLCKNRSTARDWINAGKVHYNGHRSKPGKSVELGAMIKVPSGWDSKEVKVLGVVDKRQSAPIAQTLYEETQASIDKRLENQQMRKAQTFHSPRPESRPDKKQRRDIIKFKHQ